MGVKMSVAVGQSISGGFSTWYKQNNTNRLNKDITVVGKKRDKYNRYERAFIPDESYLASCKILWDLLTPAEQSAWGDAGDFTDLNGYNLFVQDTTYRLKNCIPGVATPVEAHQYKIGHVSIPEGSGNVLFRQSSGYTPSGYITFNTWYKTALSNDGSSPNTIKLRFRYYYLSGGVLTPQVIELSMPLSVDWTHYFTGQQTVANASGGNEFEIEANNVKGDLWFDNTFVEDQLNVNTHDRYCNRVDKYWLGLNLPTGVSIESIYPTS